ELAARNLPALATIKEESDRRDMLRDLINDRVLAKMWKAMDVTVMVIEAWSAEAMKTMIGE
ncbi:MAG: hypothetical protein LE180_02500, partial [Endomicrobium sp.]|uniref:hypothetical protein n=1 Tax=Candidatus Endomicrobiellum pyrsonymphae TaxID=1408203 RepID=UPI00357B016D|nr:hypothetical protein [Endomicrobium sp.]